MKIPSVAPLPTRLTVSASSVRESSAVMPTSVSFVLSTRTLRTAGIGGSCIMPASLTEARASDSSSMRGASGTSAASAASSTPLPPGTLTTKVDAPAARGTALMPLSRSAAASAISCVPNGASAAA